MRTAFEPEGDVRSVDLPAAFASLWRQRASGVLRFSRARQTVRFEILEGDVVGVFPSDAAFETAEVLIRAGKLDAAALEGQRIPEGVDRAAAARQLGLLSERDWRWGEKIRMVEILADLTGWLDGSYEYDRAALPEPGEFRLGVQRLLLELFLRSHDRAFVHHALGAPDAPLHRADDFDEGFATLGLTPEAAPVIAAIDGRATAADISRRMPPDPFSVEKLLAALATLGLVHPEYAAETPPAIKRGRVAAPPTKPPPPPPPPAPPEWEGLPEPEPEPEPAPEPVRPAQPPPPAPEPFAPEPPPAPDDEMAERDVAAEPEPEPEPEIELPLAPSPLPSEPEPMVRDWEQSAPGPMDQPLALPEPPELLRSPRSSRPGHSFIWLLVILAAAVAALLVLRSRGAEEERERESVRPPAATMPPLATEAPESALPGGPVAETPSPLVAATALPTFAPPEPTSIPPTPSPAPSPAPTPAGAVQTPAPAPAGRAAWVARAREDRRRIEADPNVRYTIQLELVCELASVEEAWVFDRGGQMWLSTASHGGRPCFRVFWGRYATLEEARRAKETVPRFFFTPTNRPVVVATERALLP